MSADSEVTILDRVALSLLALQDLRRVALDPSKRLSVRKEAMTMVVFRTPQKITWLRRVQNSSDSPPELCKAAAEMILVVKGARKGRALLRRHGF